MNVITKAWSFTKRTAKRIKDRAVSFVRGLYDHAEATGILVLGSIGLSSLLAEVPFYLTLPMWVEAAMVVPVISVAIIAALVWSAEHRATKRLAVI